jgi:hypothetical protein
MRTLQKCFLLSLFTWLSSFGLVRAQVEVNLLDCSQCLLSMQNGKLAAWKIDWRSSFAPETQFSFDYHSLTTGKLRLAGDTILKTYFIHNFYANTFEFWDGQNWRSRYLGDFEGNIIGIGAANFDFYFLTSQQGLARIYYYDGFSSHFIGFNFEVRTADIAVDAARRAWFASSSDGDNVDQFTVVDRDGEILHKYRMDRRFDPRNIYGIAIEGEYIYLGIGPDGETYPSSLLVFKVENGRAILMERILQKEELSNYYDLGSGEPGVPGKAANPEDNPFGVFVYPNPSTGVYKVFSQIPAPISLEIYDLRGRLMHRQRLSSGEQFDLSSLASGTYIYRISVYGGFSSGKLIKL